VEENKNRGVMVTEVKKDGNARLSPSKSLSSSS
jgi:hypothetical protein